MGDITEVPSPKLKEVKCVRVGRHNHHSNIFTDQLTGRLKGYNQTSAEIHAPLKTLCGALPQILQPDGTIVRS